MTEQFDLTPNEIKAARILVESCLRGMGGNTPLDLDNDPFTWVNIQDLMDAGYTQQQAAGFFSSLQMKGFIGGEYNRKRCETFVTEKGYRYMATIWDESTKVEA